jgi:hypothetical protein
MPAKHLIHNKRQRPLSRLDSRASSLGRADRVLLLDEVMNMVRGATLQLLCFAKFMLPGSNSSSTAADHMAAPLRVPLLIGVCIDRRKPRGWSTLNGRCRAADSRAQRPFLCPARTQREWPSSRRRPNGGFMLFAGGAPPGRPRSSTHVYPRARKHGFCLPFSRRRFRARRARRRVGGSRQARLILCLPG